MKPQLDQVMTEQSFRTIWHDDLQNETTSRLIEDSLEFAIEGLDYLGVQPGRPKVIHIRRPQERGDAGRAHNDTEVSVYLCSANQAYTDYELTSVMLSQLHELLHSTRFERYPNQYGTFVADTMTQEVVAYSGELTFARQLLTDRELRWQYGHRFLQSFLRPDPEQLKCMLLWLDEVAREEAKLAENGASADVKKQVRYLYETWTDGERDDSLAVRLSAQLGGAVLRSGYGIRDVIHMPTDEVITIGKEWCEAAA